MAMFAACTNDDFISNGQGVQDGEAALRPTVGVTLNVLEGDGTDTRLGYENGYKWQEGDKIGALLMDEIRGYYEDNKPVRPFDDLEEWAEKPWTERYKLVDYVSTDYPFERQDDGTWTTNSKMLEGNYFFTFPFASYMGNREAIHSVGEQKQNGRDWETAYGENQFFIGYARIHAGTQGEDVMSANLEMTEVLGAIGLTIKNMDSDAEAFKVEKVVLTCNDFSTLLKVNPVAAKYTGNDENIEVKPPFYNLDKSKIQWWSDPVGDETKLGYFNYANYEEVNTTGDRDEFGELKWKANSEFVEEYVDGYWVNNTGRSENYKRQDALRAVVNKVPKSGDRAELTVENSPLLKEGESIQLVVMVPPYKQNISNDSKVTNPIMLYVYTDKGLAGPINISNVKAEENSGISVTTDTGVTDVRPGRKTSVNVNLDVNFIQQGAVDLKVFNESDLEQLIEWNEGQQRVYRAVLQNDVTLTPEMSAMLMSEEWQNSNLKIEVEKGKTAKVILAAGVDKKILNKVIADCEVVVEGELELDELSFINGSYTTAYGAAYEETNTKKQEITENMISVAKGGKVTVAKAMTVNGTTNWRQSLLKFGENEGEVNINAQVNQLVFEDNQGEMTVNAVVRLKADSKNTGHLTITANGNLGCDFGKLTNKGERHGNYEADIEYAVIDNYGRISELVNDVYGKLIAHADAKEMIVEENEGIIDITNDIEAEVQIKDPGTNGVIAFTATKDVEAKAIAEAGVNYLIVDGGSVMASEANGDIDASSVKFLKVTNNGGVIGGKKTIAFANGDLQVGINGDVTLENLVLGDGTTHDDYENAIHVKDGIVTIKGTVDATGRWIAIASYDWQKYAVVDAFVQIDTEATLKAHTVALGQDYNSKLRLETEGNESDAKLDNDGKVYLAMPTTSKHNVEWTGFDAKYIGLIAPATITVVDNSTLEETLKAYEDVSAVTKVIINADIDMATDKKGAFLNGKDVEISGGSIKGLSNTNVITVKNLTIKDYSTTLSGNQDKTVMLKVSGKLDINAKLELTDGWIQMASVVGVVGEGCPSISGTEGDVPDYGIICYDKDGNLMRYSHDATFWTPY